MNGKPYTLYETEGPPRRVWLRVTVSVLVGLLVIFAAIAGGSYLWFRAQVAESNQRVSEEVKVALAEKPTETLVSVTVPVPASPSAMNVLIIGSDHRADDDEKYGRSDTLMLAHVDPDNDFLSVLSIPRDLRVSIPKRGKDKINAAFAYGGPALAIRTVEQLTGINIDHYVELDFQAFRDITDALGGVYVDVDRRYYNADSRWELINLWPGYQLLDGTNALDYVRFRHDANHDFGRMARQQRFLNALREQAMGWDLAFKLPKVVSSLFSNLTTDLGANEVIRLAYWGVKLDGSRIRQVSIVSDTQYIDGLSYVIASERTIANAVEALLTIPGTDSPGTTTTAPASTPAKPATTTSTVAIVDLTGVEVDVLNANGRPGEAAAAGEWLTALGAKVVAVDNAPESGLKKTRVEYPDRQSDGARLVAQAVGSDSVSKDSFIERITVSLGEDFSLPKDYELPPTPATVPNADEWRALSGMIPFAIRAPAYLPEGYIYRDRMPREGATYDIDTGGKPKPALKMMYRFKEGGKWADQWMGITETTWLDAPAASQGLEVKRDGVTFTIVGSGQKVERVWWKQDGVLYWVSNTLSYLLDQDELLAVAESMILIPKP